MTTLPSQFLKRWQELVHQSDKRVIVLTGAGISAESGIPTFRGEDGVWTIGSKNYTPMEMATHERFLESPAEVWQWYLQRLLSQQQAQPNAGHKALVELEHRLQDRFTLITQNVDGLHLAAGNSPSRVFEIHGNYRYMRRLDDPNAELVPLPPIQGIDFDQPLSAEIQALLREKDGTWMRPHVLWFDEEYEERWSRCESALQRVNQADLLITVGTTGATMLPNLMVALVVRGGGILVDINPNRNRFSDAAEQYGGFYLSGSASEFLPQLVAACS